MREFLTDLNAKLDSRHTAVLVVDMQNDFCAENGYVDKMGKEVSGAQQVVDPIMDVVNAARRVEAMVIWILAIYDPKYLNTPMLAKRQAMSMEGDCCVSGTWGADFYGVKPLPGEYVVEKHRYSAFQSTELDSILRERSIKTLLVTGVTTNVCTESTWRDGFFNGYYIVVPADCVASGAADLHDAALKNLEIFYGDLTTSKEVASIWGAAG